LLRSGTSRALTRIAMKAARENSGNRWQSNLDPASRASEEFINWIQFATVLWFVTFLVGGCGYAGTPPHPAVTVIVQPPAANVTLGQSQQFQAIVTGSGNMAVNWNVNGIAGGNPVSGTITSSGLFTAPANMPEPSSVTITAVSEANPKDSGTATVTLQDNIAITLSPATTVVPTGGAQVFTADVSGAGNLGVGISWSINGVAGSSATLGTIVATTDSTATYTAPALVPTPATVTITATSTTDSSKSGSAMATIVCSNSLSISPQAASVALTQTQIFTASLCGHGGDIVWDVNGVVGGNSTNGTITVTGSNTALYSAPANLPATEPLTIHATAGTLVASATVTIVSTVTVNVSPPSANVLTSQRITLTPTVVGTSDTAVTWTVNGIANGSAASGLICQHASNPCQAPAISTSASVDYLAPSAVPAPNPVTVTATSTADLSRSASTTITVSSANVAVSVMISPPYAFVTPSGAEPSIQQFVATVTGSTDSNVTWTIQGLVSGQVCSDPACGSVNSVGLYTAPASAPSPNAISLTAISQADPTKSATATISITDGPAIEQILPSSVFGGALESFPMAVNGVNFVAGTGTAASVISINGMSRPTTCASTTTCSTVINPIDVQFPATLTVDIQNPGANGPLSNPVPFVVIPLDSSVGVLSLTSSQPSSTPITLVVPEPTTAAVSGPINVNAIGPLTGGNNCEIQGSPVTITRPLSGATMVSLCIQGNGLDPAFTYSFTGSGGAPAGDDMSVAASSISGILPNMIQLDLQISNATLPGVRTLFITTLNNDRATATGMLEVK
jgi:hypothetical protein